MSKPISEINFLNKNKINSTNINKKRDGNTRYGEKNSCKDMKVSLKESTESEIMMIDW